LLRVRVEEWIGEDRPAGGREKIIMDTSKITYDEKGRVKNWFSNMLPLDEPFIYGGIAYKTSENFYQAMKIPKDRNDLRAELAAMNPFKAKLAVRDKTKYPWRSDWTKELSLKIMGYILCVKFARGTSWAQKLLDTGDEEIVEFNNWGDVFWGWDIRTKRGENNLGKILMDIRKGLKDL